MEKNFRNKRDLATQLGGIIYAAERLIASKGRFRGQFDQMDQILQRDFVKFLGFSSTLKIKYEMFILKAKPHDFPEYLKTFSDCYDELKK